MNRINEKWCSTIMVALIQPFKAGWSWKKGERREEKRREERGLRMLTSEEGVSGV